MASNSATIGERSSARPFQEFVPSCAWTEDLNAYYLLVDLPEYRKEEVKLQVDDSSGRLTVSGERQINYNKYESFEKTFKAPFSSDMGAITGNFDGEILVITAIEPFQTNGNHEEAEDNNMDNNKGHNETGPSCSGGGLDLSGDILKKRKASPSPLERAIELLKKHQIVVTAVLAFSIGILLSRKLPSNRELN
ncbi:hypothetical protein K2173_027070 [Erythroxylum novogranatense]|uniref:SHSP domain-containing protein n=1 Tax=Erythroxylum novogranatense TaxID=1862640 RepID=A0AAV8U0M0_9ROSI|nr:hypothetical protein K2173_027070 [Erythroxylum novogranatense]